MVATHSPPGGPRLPVDPGRRRGVEIVKGLLALVAVVALAGGVPVGLYLAFGTPWPDTMPSTEWIYQKFTPRDALAVLVVVVWLAWLHFVLCLLVELVNERRHRGLSPRVPGGSIGTQALARRLVSAMLLLAGGVGVTMPVATAAGDGYEPPQQQTVVTQTTQRDSGTAQASGAGHAAKDAAGQQQPAGTAVRGDYAPEETPAFVKDSKAGVTKYVEVQPPEGRHYDTLWGIAERYLGDGLRYKEVYALNKGRIQPDGTALRNPDLIYPGWILRLPADAEGPGLRVGAADAEHGSEPGTQDQDKSERGGGAQRTVDSPEPDSSASGAGHEDAGTGADTQRAPTGSDVTTSEFGLPEGTTAGSFAAGGVLLAAGLLIGLRRRRGWDGGPSPRGGRALDAESDLRGAADESSARFVDAVLRSMPDSVAENDELRAPTSCVLGPDGLAMTFPGEEDVSLTRPWTGTPGDRSWLLRRSDADALTSRAAALCPFPGLVPVGYRHDVETMLDVESVSGIVSLSGDLAVARDVAIAEGLGLATQQWTDSPRVNFVGFADDLSTLAPEAIRHYDELAEVLTRLDSRSRRQQQACAAHGYGSVPAARVADPDRRLWAPEFVVLSGVPAEHDLQRLAALAGDPRSAVGVIVVGDVSSAPVRMVASSEGRLWCGPLGIDVQAHRMGAESYRDALAIFDAQRATGGQDPDGPDTPGGAAGAPVVDPDALDLATKMPVEVTMLGPVAVQAAPGRIEEERRDLLTEVTVYLALHPEGLHQNVLSAAVWPRGVEDEVRDATLAQVADWLGVTDDGTPRVHRDDSGRWQLERSGLRVDWDVFRSLANRAATGPQPRADLERALSLVAGPAWSSLPPHRYSWLAYETIEADMRVAVVTVARRLATLAVDADDVESARSAVRTGLRMVPTCEPLWRDGLRIEARFGGRLPAVAFADEMYVAVGREPTTGGAEPETDALVDELLPGYRRTAA